MLIEGHAEINMYDILIVYPPAHLFVIVSIQRNLSPSSTKSFQSYQTLYLYRRSFSGNARHYTFSPSLSLSVILSVRRNLDRAITQTVQKLGC
jgi:hypothetical protein